MTVGELEITPTRNHTNYVTLNPISYIFVLLAGFTFKYASGSRQHIKIICPTKVTSKTIPRYRNIKTQLLQFL